MCKFVLALVAALAVTPAVAGDRHTPAKWQGLKFTTYPGDMIFHKDLRHPIGPWGFLIAKRTVTYTPDNGFFGYDVWAKVGDVQSIYRVVCAYDKNMAGAVPYVQWSVKPFEQDPEMIEGADRHVEVNLKTGETLTDETAVYYSMLNAVCNDKYQTFNIR